MSLFLLTSFGQSEIQSNSSVAGVLSEIAIGEVEAMTNLHLQFDHIETATSSVGKGNAKDRDPPSQHHSPS